MKPPTPIQRSNLSGKSVEEVLKLKYEKADLVCNFWFQYGNEFSRSIEPAVTVHYDLKQKGVSEFGTNPENRQLFANNKNLRLTFQFGPVQIHDLNFKDIDGVSYLMSFSPYLKVNFAWEIDGSETDTVQKEVIEKLNTVVIDNLHKEGDDRNFYFTHFECTINTEIKSEYKNQFSSHKN